MVIQGTFGCSPQNLRSREKKDCITRPPFLEHLHRQVDGKTRNGSQRLPAQTLLPSAISMAKRGLIDTWAASDSFSEIAAGPCSALSNSWDVMMEMLYGGTVQHGGCEPHVANEYSYCG